MRCKAFETLMGTVACICAPMCCTPIRLIFYFLLLSTVSCSPQSFDVRMPSFLSHYWIPVLWRVHVATVGVMIKMFFSPVRMIMCKHLFCHALWLTIYGAHACFTVPTVWTMCLQYIIIIIIKSG